MNARFNENEFKSALQAFTDDKGLSVKPITLDSYISTADQFFRYCNYETWPPTPHQFRDWLTEIKDSINPKTKDPISPYTVHSYWTKLKCFFNYCEQSGIITKEQNPARQLQIKNIQPKTPRLGIVATPEENIVKILDYIRCLFENEKATFIEKCSLRDYVMILFLFGTGVRAGELVTFRIRDLDLVNREAFIRGEVTKNGESRKVALADHLVEWLKIWLDFREVYFPNADKYLFVTMRGGRGKGKKLAVRSINQRLKYYNDVLCQTHHSTHKYRHAFSLASMREGVSVKYVQHALGHSTPEMTLKHYQRIAEEEHLEVYKNLDLFNRLDKWSDTEENDAEES